MADPTASHVSQTVLDRKRLYVSVQKVASTYWILVVVAAFLFVTLTGRPTLFKAVYMVFFVLFLVTYQVCVWLPPCLPPSLPPSLPLSLPLSLPPSLLPSTLPLPFHR